jgi:murein DD-endopeptidase MepM/ murein hydrolase activator NlpD
MFFSAKGGKHAAFFPMDPVTIYLQRLRNRPVRVFTGYLDETPYYELYPGVIEFSASCTLKRLLHTYFDASLPYTGSFLAAYGWTPDEQGGVQNLQALTGYNSEKDGGMGSLLYATMTQIGRWNDKNIKIEALPKGLLKRMSNMLTTFEDNNAAARVELEGLIERFVGAGDYGGSGDDGSDPSTGSIKGLERIIPAIVKAADKWNVPAEMIVAVGLIETGLSNKDNPSNPHYGWFQWDNKSGPPGSYAGWGVTRSKDNGCYDLGFSSDCFAQAAAGAARQIPSLRNNTLEWAMKVQGVNGSNNPLYPSSWSQQIDKAKSFISKYGNKTPADSQDTPADNSSQAKRRDGRPDKAGGNSRLYAPIKGHTTIASPYGPRGGRNHNGIDVAVPVGTDCVAPADGRIGKFSQTTGFGEQGGMIHFVFTKDTGDVQKGTVIGWGHVSQVFKKPGEEVKAGEVIAKSGYPMAPHVHFILRTDDNDMDGTQDPQSVFEALQKGKTTSASGAPTSSPDNSSDGIMPRVNATALAVNLQWDVISGQAESQALTGNKSLMNDMPLMPFIQQMVESSMRQFMSMPNGDFFAFYPDYFGETWHRPPYWIIDDIEVLDGRVRLSDAALVTHQYSIGNRSFSGDQLTNRLLSAGVVTITDAFQTELVTSDASKKKNDKSAPELYHAFNRAMKQDEAVEFLERYGARPAVEDFPFIRNPFFELFMAYQHFMQSWARQFISPFKLTFMPELYPGGKVGFPEHGLQMYIEEVTHSWDYSSGFTTEADLSAPAVMVDKKGQPYNNNLPPNMPTALLEVAVAKPELTNADVLNPSPLAPDANGEMRPT